MGLTRRLKRDALLITVAMGLVLGACSGSKPSDNRSTSGSTPTPRSKVITPGPGCKVPKEKPNPAWMPRELPLPPDTYFYRDLGRKGGFDRGRFVVSIDTVALRKFVREKWPQADISLARQDTEPGEVEALFTTPRGTGLYKANDVLCDPPYTTLLVIYSK